MINDLEIASGRLRHEKLILFFGASSVPVLWEQERGALFSFRFFIFSWFIFFRGRKTGRSLTGDYMFAGEHSGVQHERKEGREGGKERGQAVVCAQSSKFH